MSDSLLYTNWIRSAECWWRRFIWWRLGILARIISLVLMCSLRFCFVSDGLVLAFGMGLSIVAVIVFCWPTLGGGVCTGTLGLGGCILGAVGCTLGAGCVSCGGLHVLSKLTLVGLSVGCVDSVGMFCNISSIFLQCFYFLISLLVPSFFQCMGEII